MKENVEVFSLKQAAEYCRISKAHLPKCPKREGARCSTFTPRAHWAAHTNQAGMGRRMA